VSGVRVRSASATFRAAIKSQFAARRAEAASSMPPRSSSVRPGVGTVSPVGAVPPAVGAVPLAPAVRGVRGARGVPPVFQGSLVAPVITATGDNESITEGQVTGPPTKKTRCPSRAPRFFYLPGCCATTRSSALFGLRWVDASPGPGLGAGGRRRIQRRKRSGQCSAQRRPPSHGRASTDNRRSAWEALYF